MVKIIKKQASEKTIFSTCIFNLSPCGFTQISIGSTHSMGNSIPHPPSNEYPLGILLVDLDPQNNKYMKKRDDDINITFFHVFLIF